MSAVTFQPDTEEGAPTIDESQAANASSSWPLVGRDEELRALSQMVSERAYRAGLLYGESGVGKTALVRQGLLPYLQTQDVIALYCRDVHRPQAAFANAIAEIAASTESGSDGHSGAGVSGSAAAVRPEQGEAPLSFLDRMICGPLRDCQFLFIVDGVDVALLDAGAAVIAELSSLYSRLVTRAAGRVRFLFTCDSDNVYLLSELERRTGSLFPPTNRIQLQRYDGHSARMVLPHIWASVDPSGNMALSPEFIDALVTRLAADGPVLATDLEVVALAVRALGIGAAAQLDTLQVGDDGDDYEDMLHASSEGVPEVVDSRNLSTSQRHPAVAPPPSLFLARLVAAWAYRAVQTASAERASLRLLAELASEPAPMSTSTLPAVPGAGFSGGRGSLPVSWLAARAGIDPTTARSLLAGLHQSGFIRVVVDPRTTQHANREPTYALAHHILAPRIRALAGPKLLGAERARALLADRARERKPLWPHELWQLRREQVGATTASERAILKRTKRIYSIVAAAVVAVPLMVLLVVYLSMSGRYYLDIQATQGGDRLVARAGRANLSGFNWLPASPGFGDVVADLGLSVAMVDDEAWSGAQSNELAGAIDDRESLGQGYAAAALGAMTPTLRAFFRYASDGSIDALNTLTGDAQSPAELTELLDVLGAIARGTQAEVAFIESALSDPSPAIQASALMVAARAAQRQPGRYHNQLVRALASSDDELRRLAFAAVRDLGRDTAQKLFRTALGAEPNAAARRELLAEVTGGDAIAEPAAAASVLANGDISARTRQRARQALRRAFSADAQAAAIAAATLVADDKAPAGEKVFALELVRDRVPEEAHQEVADAIKSVLQRNAATETEAVRAAALPVYARVAPEDAAAELAVLLQNPDLGVPLKVAMALAWGEVAKTGESAAAVALEDLLQDEAPRVRAAAAEAYGNIGRRSQEELTDLVKTARFDVATGAAMGLANSLLVGGSRSGAMGGIGQMWRRKGRPRLTATTAYVRLARKRPAVVYSYLAAAARTSDDSQLRVVGTQGLCEAAAGGHKPSERALLRASLDTTDEVRRVAMECVAENAFDANNSATIAVRLSFDGDPDVRTDAARALLRVVEVGRRSEQIIRALSRLLGDSERPVRVLAMRILIAMAAGEGAGEPLSDDARTSIVAILERNYDRADQDERLQILDGARALESGEIIQRGLVDAAPAVRIAALDTALATGTAPELAVNGALSDTSPVVRRAALSHLATGNANLQARAVDKSLTLALRDSDPAIAAVALTTLAQVGDAEAVTERLRTMLGERSERLRIQAARACIGLVDRAPDTVRTLLEPLLNDPAHDVRAAVLPALARAYAAMSSAEELAALLRQSETHAMRRLMVTAAFWMLATQAGQGHGEASDPAQAQQAIATLDGIADSGMPLGRAYASLVRGLIDSNADGIAMLQRFVP